MPALYRKYRPQDFDEVVGQEAVVRTLRNAISGDKVRQAYLFAGPRGTGKTSLARILAKGLNCEQGPTVTPDKTCNSCRTIAAGTSLDVVEICCDLEHHVVNASHTHPDVVAALEGTHWFEVNEWATTGPGADAGSGGATPHAA